MNMKIPPQILVSMVNFIVSLVELLLVLRITLKLFAASTVAPFVQWVYETTEPLLAPFAGMFPSPRLTDGFVIEFSALFALMVYAFVGYLFVDMLDHLQYQAMRRSSGRGNKKNR